MNCERIELCNVIHPKYPDKLFLDFRVGRFQLSKHFTLSGLCSLSVSNEYGKQLLLKKPSPFESGRVPIYVCECCADLGCGALTVEVQKLDGCFSWKNFGYEDFDFTRDYGSDSPVYTQTKYMERMGEFVFEYDQYRSIIQPYS